MEEQTMDENEVKNPGQQESAYGSLESSSQGQSQKRWVMVDCKLLFGELLPWYVI